jgi:integrase
MKSNQTVSNWQRLQGRIAKEVFTAPKTAADIDNGQRWQVLGDRAIKYIESNVLGQPWTDHLALAALVLAARGYDLQTIVVSLHVLQPRLLAIFQALGITEMREWKPALHIPAYLKAELLPDDNGSRRLEFWKRYNTASKQVKNWIESLPEEDRARYEKFALPSINRTVVEGLLKWREVQDLQRQGRKTDTDVLTEHYSTIRSVAHLRRNKLARLYHAYYETLQKVRQERPELPFAFNYEDGTERIECLIWDRRSLVLKHRESYSPATIKDALKRRAAYSDDKNGFFLEVSKVENLLGTDPPEGFWFEELIRLHMLNAAPARGTADVLASRQKWLRQWGYGDDTPDVAITPFGTDTPGLLQWPISTGEGHFANKALDKTGHVLIPVESLYAGATFGLLAIDIFTTTGMRINELMQISLDEECFVIWEDEHPAKERQQIRRTRYAFRLIPKGERTEKLHTFVISQETVRLVEMTARMLEEHYKLDVNKGGKIPILDFASFHTRSHRFGKRRYLFQYNQRHLTNISITACMKFLLHGLVLQSSSGKPVVVSPHKLRHAFATYAHQVKDVPLDVIGWMLKQKDLEVTSYYSQLPEKMAVERVGNYLEHFATTIHGDSAHIRLPEDLQKQLAAARHTVGPLAETLGGDCTCYGICPVQFACIGCAAMVPDPKKRHQVEREHIRALRWAEEATEEGRYPDAERWKQHARRCTKVLEEMTQIETYRKDANYVPLIQLEARS